MAKLLVIDDEGVLVRFVSKVLNGRGHMVVVARDGATGVARVATENPDLVIVDSDLPKIDGTEVCRQIKAARAAQTAVILMTPSYQDFYGFEDALAPDAMIVRPFTRDVLINAVERALGGAKRAERA